MKDGIVRIFPTLMDQPFSIVRCVFYKSISVGVAEIINPVHRGPNMLPNGLNKGTIICAAEIPSG